MAALFHRVLLIQCLVCSSSLFPVPLCAWILNAISARLRVKSCVTFHLLLLLMLSRDNKCPGVLPAPVCRTAFLPAHTTGLFSAHICVSPRLSALSLPSSCRSDARTRLDDAWAAHARPDDAQRGGQHPPGRRRSPPTRHVTDVREPHRTPRSSSSSQRHV